ncbi:uncharacterized protein LOC131291066 [Anopheles ziemanni]|nr:uncharacterized protein LOC131291066 [Anopheles ziemanni]
MGANVSSSARHHAKGLPGGRRAQSIDNLKSDTTQYFHQYHHNNNNNHHHHGDPFHPQTFLPEPEHVADDGGGEKPPPPDLACIDTSRALPRRDHWSQQQQQQQPTDQHAIYVSQKDRNKFCGSLPNHLDLDGDSALDRDCQAIVRQNEFLQANLKNVQQHQQQQQQQPTRNNGPVQQPIGTPTRLSSMAPYSGQHSSEQQQQQQQQQDQPFPQQPTTYHHRQQHSFPPAVALGGSGVGVGSTFRSNTTESGLQQQHQQLHHHLQLKLPLHRTNVDAGCDQGYGSERSPEDELPPPLLLIHEAQYNEILASSAAQRASAMHTPSLAEGHRVDDGSQGAPAVAQTDQSSGANDTADRDTAAQHLQLVGPYSFITEDCIFYVSLTKGPRGVGLSVSGGIDSAASYPGLIRIKRIFPHQAAWATGLLQSGDILLEVNGCPLTGLTNFQALVVLRSAADEMTLTVARPKGDQHLQLSPQTEPPKPPLRVTLSSEYFPRPQPVAQESPVSLTGEFEIVLTKQQGSLGFTLSDESVHGHYVRMLMREPALTDGRIRPGDRILEVNHVPISSMTHSEAVLFLRRAADVVLLRLYRDPSSADSDSLSSSRPGSADRCARPKVCLRPEARSLLSALAATRQQQQQQQQCQQHTTEHSDPAAKAEDANSRRLRRGGLPAHRRPHGTTGGQQSCNYPDSCSDAASNASQDDERYYSDWELDYLLAEECSGEGQLLGDGDGDGSTGVPLSRPTFLDLDASCGGGGDATSTPNAPDRGEAPEAGRDFTSLPCETFLVACKTDRDLQAGEDAYTDAIYVQHFARKSPLYSSVNVPASSGPSELVDAVQQGGKQSLLKWYGASMLDGEDGGGGGGLQPNHDATRAQSVTPDLTVASETPSCSLGATRSTTPTTEIELYEHYAALALGRDTEGCEIFTADLHKGWNSRLGFSLKSEPDGSGRARTVISAIHPDSVASRNGRLRVGDVLLSVNEDSVESMPTAQVIELLRNARGSIFLVLMRPAGGGEEGDPAAGKLQPTPEEPEDELDVEDAFRLVEELNRTLPEGASDGVADGLE